MPIPRSCELPRHGLVVRFVLIALVAVTSGATAAGLAADEPRKVHMPDGQLQSHLISVYVTGTVTAEDKPRLRLTAGHSVTNREKHEGRRLQPAFVVPHQQWAEDPLGTRISETGTLLLFDLSRKELIPWYKAMSRFRPIVEWDCNGTLCTERAVGPREVNLGRTATAWAWTIFIVLALLGFLALLVGGSKNARPTLKALCVENGRYSLARTQILIWTVGIGAMVLFYGLVRLTVPTIPETLLALMAMSLLTGGVTYVSPASPSAAPARDLAEARLSDLVLDFSPAAPQGVVSIARAQMLFWTLLVALLFVVKSALDGALWDVPVQLVALMGISQAGYVLPKFDTWVTPSREATDARNGP